MCEQPLIVHYGMLPIYFLFSVCLKNNMIIYTTTILGLLLLLLSLKKSLMLTKAGKNMKILLEFKITGFYFNIF